MGKSTPKLRQIDSVQHSIDQAGCIRQTYIVDHCATHSEAWPYDEAVCNYALIDMGMTPRKYLGDGKAEGVSILDTHIWSPPSHTSVA